MNSFSLINFTDSVCEALFFQREPAKKLADSLPAVAELQGRPGAYAGMFAAGPGDADAEMRVFTGEPVRSRAAARHILGEETCRALRLMFPRDPAAAEALRRADAGMAARLHETDRSIGQKTGVYCCGFCTCALLRNIAAGAFDHRAEREAHALREIKKCRDGRGRWRRFPFYYTLLALSGLDSPAAREETAYAATAIASALMRTGRSADKYERRRKVLLERLSTL